MPSIKFEMVDGESSFLDPRSGFRETVEKFQVRFDPLTGRTGHLSHFGAIKPQRLLLENYELPEIKGKCPFCPEVRSRTTPKFPERVLPEGRAEAGEATLIPNLFPYDVYSSVIIMTDDHVVPVDRLSEKRIYDAFSLGVDFLKKIGSLDPSLPYHVITWNYMPPAGEGSSTHIYSAPPPNIRATATWTSFPPRKGSTMITGSTTGRNTWRRRNESARATLHQWADPTGSRPSFPRVSWGRSVASSRTSST